MSSQTNLVTNFNHTHFNDEENEQFQFLDHHDRISNTDEALEDFSPGDDLPEDLDINEHV